MKRMWVILLCGLLLGAAAYAAVYAAATASQRSIEKSARPELAWLRHEFHLNDEQYARVAALHDAYKPTCMEMCHRIDGQNARLERLLAATSTVTPEIEQALVDLARVRADCQAAMLRHFFAVSRAMDPDEGARYLDWVQRETLLPARMVPTEPSGAHHMP